MNFYEASRFQYAAARLMVKLAQFRREGKFVQNITNGSNFNIVITSQEKGSFDINTESPDSDSGDKSFVDMSMADLLSYVSERLIEKTDENELLNSVAADGGALNASGAGKASKGDEVEELLAMLASDDTLRKALRPEARELVERRIAEKARQARLEAVKKEVAKIDAPRAQKLISMSAPLVREMAVALRKSATTMEVVSNKGGTDSSVIYLNQRMAADIENSVVDKNITPIMADIIQYNKENGSGKLRLFDRKGVFGFSVPSDIKYSLQSKVISALDSDEVYLQTYFVRDKARELSRLIVVGVLPTPDK